MQGAMESFLNTLTYNTFFGGLEKRIILIKDECHIATNNLDSISDTYFDKVINFSATPNLRRGQNPDVEITDDEAVNASLIKRVELGDEEDTIGDALNKFEAGKVVTPEMLKEAGLVKQVKDGIKILGDGKLEKNLTVQAHKFTKTAVEKIESAGGKVEVI